MSTPLGDSNEESSTAGVASAGAAVLAGGPFYDSLEEESSQSLSDSLSCHRRRDSGPWDSFSSRNSFSDSLEDSGEASDTTATLDSDTGSFYSVQSYRTTRANDSVASLLNSGTHSETTLYDSAQSIHTLPTSSLSSFVSLDNRSVELDHPDAPFHRNSVCSQRSVDRRGSEPCWEYTSCPDLSPVGYRRTKGLLEDPGRLSHKLILPSANNLCVRCSPRLSPQRKRAVTSASMSAVDGAPSPKLADEADKKKKGLMSSFRKSRKTGRKLRQQKKASEGGPPSTGTGVPSDVEQDFLLDSESSAPNSPAPVKSDAFVTTKSQEKAEDSEMTVDSHQAAHERLNGSAASPKGSAASSKTPSPVSTKSTKIEEGVKKADEKEEKKKEKSKFGSFLARKDKKQKFESGSKSSIISNASAASSVTTDASLASADVVTTSDSSEMKADERGDTVKDESEPPTAAAETTNTEDAASGPADPQSPSFRSYISTVQFVKNWSVNAEVPKDRPAVDAKYKKSVDKPEKKTEPQETTSTVETKKITSSADGKPSTAEATSSTDKREHLYKILVIGELGTGKTSIIKRYVHQFFSQHYRATIGVDFALKVLNWDSNTVIRLQLWDIAGQERFGNMTRVYYKEAVGAFVVFDVTRAQTFDAVAKWKTDLDTKVTLADGSPIPTVLLANKCDQPKEGVVNNPARMDDYCRERGFSGWFETSAKENINIDEASRFLVNKILNNEKQGMMMTESMDTDKFSVDGKTNPVDKSGCRC